MAVSGPTKIGAQKFRVDVVGTTATPIHLKGRRTVIVICDDDDDIKVYLRGRVAAPVGDVSNGTPYQWLWHLAYHLTTMMKELEGDTSRVTDRDVDMTLVKTMHESPLKPGK